MGGPWDGGAPVQRLTNLGRDNLWIKRNDVISPVYGGNKVCKLEFSLAEALARGKKRIVTLGAIGSNHGLATAIFCRRLGLECALLLFDQPVTSYVRRNLLLFFKNGAELFYQSGMTWAGFKFYVAERLKDPRAFFLYAGGTSPLGNLGPVSGALELKRQVGRGLLPEPRYVLCPHASNGTLAGLTLGFRLAGFDTTVIGVRVGVAKTGPLPLSTPGVAAASVDYRDLPKKLHWVFECDEPEERDSFGV